MKPFFTRGIEEISASVSWDHSTGIDVPEPFPLQNLKKMGDWLHPNIPKDTSKIEALDLPGWLLPSEPTKNSKFYFESSLGAVYHRMSGAWAWHGFLTGHFPSADDALVFRNECLYCLIHQIAAPTSLQFVSTGLSWSYGIRGDKQTAFHFDKTGGIHPTVDRYTRPQVCNKGNVGYINLLKFLKPNPDNKTWTFRIFHFLEAIKIWTRVLDISLDMSSYPSEARAVEAFQTRPMALYLANFEIFRASIGVGPDDTRTLLKSILDDTMYFQVWASSAALGTKLGAFPGYALRKSEWDVMFGTRCNSAGKSFDEGWAEERQELGTLVFDNFQELLDNLAESAAYLKRYQDSIPDANMSWTLRNSIQAEVSTEYSILEISMNEPCKPAEWFDEKPHPSEVEDEIPSAENSNTVGQRVMNRLVERPEILGQLQERIASEEPVEWDDEWIGNVDELPLPPTDGIEVNAKGAKQCFTGTRCDLLPPLTLLAISKILYAGAKKYGDKNWRDIPVNEHVNHALRHWFMYACGDRSEDHMGHMACRILFALELTEKENVDE